jgi:hypothetical protein
MHRKLSGRAAAAAAALAFSAALATAGSAAPAEAASGAGSGSCQSGGGSSGGGGGGSGADYRLWVQVSSQIPACAGGGNASQSDGGSGVSVHIPCWWGPEYDPQGLADYVNSFAATSSTSGWYAILQAEYDKNGTDPLTSDYRSTDGPQWESYNVGAQPTGEWYGLIFNSGDTSDQLKACTDELTARSPEEFYWGVNGTPPADLPTDVPGFTAKDLAQYVESVVELPSANVNTSPRKGAPATIGLPVWYWQKAGTATTHLGAYVCALGVCVTFNADAVSFTIDPGTTSAVTYTDCNLRASTNTLGTPYANQPPSQNPPCGVRYTAPAPGVTPSVATTWHVAITWPGGSWGPPKDPVIITALPRIRVQDIQALNQTSASPTPAH